MRITKARLKEIIKEEVQNFKASTEVIPENNASRNIRKLEHAIKLVEMSNHELDIERQPEIAKNLDMAMKVLHDLYENMHDLLDVPSNTVQMQDQE